MVYGFALVHLHFSPDILVYRSAEHFSWFLQFNRICFLCFISEFRKISQALYGSLGNKVLFEPNESHVRSRNYGSLIVRRDKVNTPFGCGVTRPTACSQQTWCQSLPGLSEANHVDNVSQLIVHDTCPYFIFYKREQWERHIVFSPLYIQKHSICHGNVNQTFNTCVYKKKKKSKGCDNFILFRFVLKA